MSEDTESGGFLLDSEKHRSPYKHESVEKDLSLLKDAIQQHLNDRYSILPDIKKGNIDKDGFSKYVQDHPQSVLFISPKDLHLFPLVINQYKKFADKFPNKKSNRKFLDLIEKHEMEHVRATWQTDNSGFNGIGIITFRNGEEPIFRSFINYDETLSKKEKLKVILASTSHFDGDVSLAIKTLTKNTSIRELMSDLSDPEIRHLVGTQLLPKATISYSLKLLGKMLEPPPSKR